MKGHFGQALGRDEARMRGRRSSDDTAAMIQIERYLLRTATTAAVSGLVVLTGVVWVTQALRQIDLITSKGQTILIFLMITGAGAAFADRHHRAGGAIRRGPLHPQ